MALTADRQALDLISWAVWIWPSFSVGDWETKQGMDAVWQGHRDRLTSLGYGTFVQAQPSLGSLDLAGWRKLRADMETALLMDDGQLSTNGDPSVTAAHQAAASAAAVSIPPPRSWWEYLAGFAAVALGLVLLSRIFRRRR